MSEAGLQSRALHLLSLAKTIRHYEEALSQANGERFNIFDVLHVGHYEVQTHSPILAELLNPKGAHGQGAVFLRNFLTELKISDVDTESARVRPEVSIGELGRLDIVITDGNGRTIIIENKIYAGLRENQLKDYHDHNPRANLLFLTLEGEVPGDWTTNAAYKTEAFKKVFQRVSYKTNIERWLETCRKEAATAPGVREAITQYIHLIQRLTNQNTSTSMNQQLTQAVLNDKESFLAYSALCKAQKAVHTTVIVTFASQLAAVARELKLVPSLPTGDMSQTYDGFSLSCPLLDQQGIRIHFEFGKAGYRECYFGFCPLNKNVKSPVVSDLQEAFKLEFGQNKSNESWLVWMNWDEHFDWVDDTFMAIQFGSFADDLKKLLERLMSVVSQACKRHQAKSTK